MKALVAPTLIFMLLGSTAGAADIGSSRETALLQADNFSYDQEKQTFTANGHVELEQEGQMVFADNMVYDRLNDQVTASGNVVFVDKQGQVYFAQKVNLQNELKTGAVEQIGLVFPDGSRAAARSAHQNADNTITLRDALYSPCNLCETDPSKPPLWQLRSKKVVHDKNTQDIYYHNATLDVYGTPVLYAPYFSHPDPSVTARSGVLIPKASTDSKKGLMLRNYYYHNVSPHEDVTLEVSPTQKAGTVYGAEWRKKFARGNLLFQGSLNRSSIRGGSDDDRIIEDKDWRGHFFANGLYNINQNWRAGVDYRRTLDRYYLKDFDYRHNDILTSNLYAERFKGRDYSTINASYFQDLRPDTDQEQPQVLPWARHEATGDPNALMGGRWAWDSETVSLLRDGDQSMSRISTMPSWERRDILSSGVQTTINGKLRADGYWSRDENPYLSHQGDSDAKVARLTPSGNFGASYPLIRPGEKMDTLIEPKVALTVAPNMSHDSRIPNEDSRDVQLDMSNLFDYNRFPGVDRQENGSHVSYGIKAGGYMKNGNSAFATIGQSYRMSSRNPFPQGSGLENDRSDIVGQIEATFQDKFYTDYRFQLEEEDFSPNRHELQAAYINDRFEARTNYVYTHGVAGTGLIEDRQQIGLSTAASFTEKWSVGVDGLHDLSGEAGLLKAGGTLQYKNECLRLSLRAERDLTDRSTGGSDTRVLFSIGLRNLGDYDTPILEDDQLYRPFDTESKI